LAASPDRHALLTIRNLTAHWRGLVSSMRVIKIKRTVFREKQTTTSSRRSFLQFARDFFARENHLEFAIEALLFAALLAISAWPMVAAAGAITGLL
jgi:hypothetical protein